ncbi:MAG: cell division protein ZapD [Pseudomonadota bacterium]
MPQPAETLRDTQSASRDAEYEQPLTERLRTFLRLEFLYQQTLFHAEGDADWSSRAAIASLLEITAILLRGDVRSEVLKELERQIDALKRFQSQPGVDTGRLGSILGTLTELRGELRATGPHYLQPLKDCEFLSAIKHRSAIPGGTCEFDLPDYSHWLRQPYERRQGDLESWIRTLRPLCDAVMEMMWITREGAPIEDVCAEGGMFQHSVGKEVPCRLLRVILPHGATVFPEISGSRHRFTIRFMRWNNDEKHAEPVRDDIEFQLSVC